MAIIMVDWQDALDRADQLEKMGDSCSVWAALLREDESLDAELTDTLREYGEELHALARDVRISAGIWEEFYRTNVRLDSGEGRK